MKDLIKKSGNSTGNSNNKIVVHVDEFAGMGSDDEEKEHFSEMKLAKRQKMLEKYEKTRLAVTIEMYLRGLGATGRIIEQILKHRAEGRKEEKVVYRFSNAQVIVLALFAEAGRKERKAELDKKYNLAIKVMEDSLEDGNGPLDGFEDDEACEEAVVALIDKINHINNNIVLPLEKINLRIISGTGPADTMHNMLFEEVSKKENNDKSIVEIMKEHNTWEIESKDLFKVKMAEKVLADERTKKKKKNTDKENNNDNSNNKISGKKRAPMCKWDNTCRAHELVGFKCKFWHTHKPNPYKRFKPQDGNRFRNRNNGQNNNYPVQGAQQQRAPAPQAPQAPPAPQN